MRAAGSSNLIPNEPLTVSQFCTWLSRNQLKSLKEQFPLKQNTTQQSTAAPLESHAAPPGGLVGASRPPAAPSGSGGAAPL